MIRNLYQKCCITFFFQVSLIFFVMDEGGEFVRGSFQMNSTRIICSYLLHLIIMPEVRCSIDMMKYIKNNVD